MNGQDIDVYFRYKIDCSLTVRIIPTVNGFEHGITLFVQELLCNISVPVQNRPYDFLVCITVYFHH